MTSIFRQVLTGIAVFSATPAAAQSFEDIAALEQRVMAALGAGIGEPDGPARPVDRRLRLAACPAPVVIEAPVMGAATARCEPLGWRIRIPVVQSAAAAPMVAAPVMSAPRQTARTEPVIRRGDPVPLVVIAGGFTVSRQAIAEEDGRPGDRIRVRTEPRTPPIIGLVLEDGRVALPGFN